MVLKFQRLKDGFSKLKRTITNRFTSQEAPTTSQGHRQQYVGARTPGGGHVVGPTLADEDGRSTTVASVQPRETQTINVIFFGETGAGKSSVINLIAQRDVATVSPDVVGCTMESTRYDISFDDMKFSIFDTIGLNQPVFERNSHLEALEGASKFIDDLTAAGGIHLLLCCMRGGRMSLTTRNNYQLFSKSLCQEKVPVALVVTGLEGEVEMEDWWTRNKAHIESYGIKSDGHACLTTVTNGTPGEDLKYTESQQKIRELLKSCSLKTGAFLLDATTWLAMTGTGMRSLTKEGSNPKRRDIEKVLSGRLIHPDSVKRIIDMMETSTSNGEH